MDEGSLRYSSEGCIRRKMKNDITFVYFQNVKEGRALSSPPHCHIRKSWCSYKLPSPLSFISHGQVRVGQDKDGQGREGQGKGGYGGRDERRQSRT